MGNSKKNPFHDGSNLLKRPPILDRAWLFQIVLQPDFGSLREGQQLSLLTGEDALSHEAVAVLGKTSVDSADP